MRPPTNYHLTAPFPQLLDRPHGEFHVYHDETWPEASRHPVTGHGVLYVPTSRRGQVFERLQEIRGTHRGEIKFTNITTESRRSETFRIASEWVSAYFNEFNHYCAFKAAIALHDGPLLIPYQGEPGWWRHLRNSTSHPFVGLTRFALKEFDSVDVIPIFDDTGDLKTRAEYRAGIRRFINRVNRRRRLGNERYPWVSSREVLFRASDPRKALTREEQIDAELLQLVDLLMGSAEQSLNFRESGRAGRLRLAENLAEGMGRFWNKPWGQFGTRARRFTVTLWPDDNGLPYPAVPTRTGRPILIPSLRTTTHTSPPLPGFI